MIQAFVPHRLENEPLTWAYHDQRKDVKPVESCGPGGNRTLDLRIKSPLLCRLSYRPAYQASGAPALS